MDSTIWATIITGAVTLIGVLLSNVLTHNKTMAEMDKKQAVTDTKLEALTREVRKHNNFAERMPVVEEKLRVANHRIDDLEEAQKK